MTLPLDVRSIALACSIAHVAVAIAMTYVWMSRKTYEGFGAWTLSAWSAFAGILLLSARGFIPEFLTILLANLLLLATSSWIVVGLLAFTGRRPNQVLHIGFLLLYEVFAAVFTYAHPSLQARLALFSLCTGGLGLLTAYLAWKRLPTVLHDANPLVLGAALFVTVVYLVRGFVSLAVPPPTEDLMAISPLQGLSLLVYLFCNTLLSVALLVLNGQRVERDLQLAVEECKVLQGILPICAHCKKIRDDQGAWNQLEAYISHHTDAEFSHGICPDCARTFFPKLG